MTLHQAEGICARGLVHRRTVHLLAKTCEIQLEGGESTHSLHIDIIYWKK